ncbi:MAG: T9SS type A sorting domain-containing protein [Bacteroidetes bacterium]|jgi:ligand-binding sensor domain-containing protein|nr:T9SS type A sorting domain-containing protein [Bacteroidota bacterium]MDF1866519.1 two-component regulator propeller domain-containing protein [Saprospiraceae bacterium]
MIKKFTQLLLVCLFFSGSIQAQILTSYTTADGLINNTANCVNVDADDNVWFGTQAGISKFDGTTWTSFDQTSYPGLVDNVIKAIFIDADDVLWVGTDFGISKFDGTTWTTYTTAEGLLDNRVFYINQDNDGAMWFGNNDGVSKFDGATWTSWDTSDGLPFGGVNYIIFDENNVKYFGTGLGGVYIFDDVDFVTITEDEGLLNDKIRGIALAENGDRWIGTSDGVSVFNSNNEFVVNHEFIFTLPPPDELNPIEDIKIDSRGRVWAGIYVDYLVTEGGVSTFDGIDAWTQYEVVDGLAGPVVRQLAVTSNDDVWVATSTGVTKISEIPASTFDAEVANAIHLFPNPATTQITMELPEALIGKDFQVFNYVGNLVSGGQISNAKMTFEISDLANGFYVVSIDGVYHNKVMVSK